MRAAVRSVLGEDAPGEPARWRPHISIAYCRQALHGYELGSWLMRALVPGTGERPSRVVLPVTGVLFVQEQDTFAANGLHWDPATAHIIPLGHSERD